MNSEKSELSDRREFLRSLGKWSAAAITAILVVEETVSRTSAQWASRPRSWVNGSGGGGGWVSNCGGGGGSWVNRRG